MLRVPVCLQHLELYSPRNAEGLALRPSHPTTTPYRSFRPVLRQPTKSGSRTRRSTSVATITGQRARSTSPACDTPRDAETFSPRHDGLSYAPEPAQSARGRVAVRHAPAGRYAARPDLARRRPHLPREACPPLPAEPPASRARCRCTTRARRPADAGARPDPAASPETPLSASTSTTRPPSSASCSSLGGRYVADVPRRAAAATSSSCSPRRCRGASCATPPAPWPLRFPAIDTAPMSLGGQISPPGPAIRAAAGGC